METCTYTCVALVEFGRLVPASAELPLVPQTAEVDRLVSLGATRIDIGQDDVSWVAMADPDGNEFCVLTPRERDQVWG